MNDLLFYTLIIALLYYFFLYLPQQKKEPTKLTHCQFTQTNPTPITHSENTAELEQQLYTLIKSIQQLNKQIK